MASGAWLNSRLGDRRFTPYQAVVDPWYQSGQRPGAVGRDLPGEDVIRFSGEVAPHTFAERGSSERGSSERGSSERGSSVKANDSSSSSSDGEGGRKSKRTGEKKKGRCWTGYEPVPGKKPYSDGSCQKA
ncbi:MAG: hypothetical protein ACKVI4_17180 [Actinomycetales bacterium]